VQIRMSHTRAASGPLSDIFSCLLDRAGRNAVSRTREDPPPNPPLRKRPKETHLHLNIHQCVTQGTPLCQDHPFVIPEHFLYLSDGVSS